jgi:hypothetical protein
VEKGETTSHWNNKNSTSHPTVQTKGAGNKPRLIVALLMLE